MKLKGWKENWKVNLPNNEQWVKQIDYIYKDENGVTIKATEKAEPWKEYKLNWVIYYIAKDKEDIQKKLKEKYPAERIVTTFVTDMSMLFYKQFEITLFNHDVSNWDVSNVTDMCSMFEWYAKFNCYLNNWDVSKVKDMYAMFSWCQQFDKPLNKWNTSNVENMINMFAHTYVFNQDIWDWDVSKVKAFIHMFYWAEKFNNWWSDSIKKWKFRSWAQMDWMFQYAREFNQNISTWRTSWISTHRDFFDWVNPYWPKHFQPRFLK